jgi:DNA polymerase/3'-5' exonuclease PolX
MEYERALSIANEVKDILSPFCSRCEIAGSIRRKKNDCGDVEIVCIPKKIREFCDAVNKWQKIKGEPIGKYTQRIHKSGMKLDIFMATPENWGCIFLIRTGPWEFSKDWMSIIVKKSGQYEQKEGHLHFQGNRIPVLEERDYFDFMGIPYIEPENRNETVLSQFKNN